MKKIKFFFIRHYQRIIRFLISFSAIGCILAASFSASATAVYSVPYSRPQISSNSGYLEIVTPNWGLIVIYVSGYISGNTPAEPIDWTFKASISGDNLVIRNVGGNVYTSSNGQKYTLNLCGVYITQTSGMANLVSSDGFLSLYIGNMGVPIGSHGYNIDNVSLSNSMAFTVLYGNEVNTNDKLDKIIAAIEANKSSAEKNNYSGPSSDQKTAQADLDKAEASINADTATARADTINLFKTFSIVGDIAKGMLAVTNIFNVLTGDLVFAPALLNFSLAVGAAAFLLGLSAIILKVVRSKE